MGNMNTKKLHGLFRKLRLDEPVTLKDFQLAKMEHDSWIQRYEDIVAHEDPYSNLNEMRNILNYHNSNLVKPLFDYVLPTLKPNSDPEALKQLYYKALLDTQKVHFVDGTPTFVD